MQLGAIRDGNAIAALAKNAVADAAVKEANQILAIAANVHPDGTEATLTLHTLEGSYKLMVDDATLAAIQAEIHATAALMLYRQALRGDDDNGNAFDATLRTALRPADCSVVIDRQNADRLFLLQFADRLPLAIRMTPDAVADSLDQLETVSRRAAN